VMTSFSFATVAGVPIGLFLANNFGWHIPFFMLAATSSIVLLVGCFTLPPIRGHLVHGKSARPIQALVEILKDKNNLNSFFFNIAVVIAGFAVIPYLSPFLVSNVGLAESDLPYIYLFGGGATIFTSRFFGKLCDRFGKQRTFAWIVGGSAVPILVVTNLPHTPLWCVLVITTVFMVLVSGRWIPAMAIVTAGVTSQQRGGFMSINASIQQVTSGLASFGAGLILGKSGSGELTHFGIVGALAIVTSVTSIYLSKKIRTVEGAENMTSQEFSFESM
jgi:MFS transporter, DHA1 family, inner membrane transport protein